MPRGILMEIILSETTWVLRGTRDAMLIRVIVIIHHVWSSQHCALRRHLLILDVIETSVLLLLLH